MKKIMFFAMSILVLVLGIGLFTAQSSFSGGRNTGFTGNYRVYGSTVNPQFSNPSFYRGAGVISPEYYWPEYEKEDCEARQDFVMQIAPGGCSPAVVRSDLLEEQPVPVFCRVMAVQVNPFIDVSEIKSLHFPEKDYPDGVSQIGYYPARAAVRSQTQLTSSPIKDNLGYLVIVLSQNEVEDEMPDWVEGNVTAVIDYDAEGAFGVGQTNFYASEMSNEEWKRDYREYGFWNGKGYVRAESIEGDRAQISIYRDAQTRDASVTLREGEYSRDLYLGGSYCAAGLNVGLKKIDVPVETALLQVNDQQMWVAERDRILDRCRVRELDSYGGGGSVELDCPVKNGDFKLSLNPGKANFSTNGMFKEYAIGEQIGEYWVGYIGEHNEESFTVLINESYSSSGADFSDKGIYGVIESVLNENQNEVLNDLKGKIEDEIYDAYTNRLKVKQSKVEENVGVHILKEGDNSINGIKLENVLVAKNREWGEEEIAEKYYENATNTYKDLYDFYPNEKSQDNEDAYAAMGLYEAAKLSKKVGMNEDAIDYYNELIKNYPGSSVVSQAIKERELLMRYDTSDSKAVLNMDNEQYFIDLLDFDKPSINEVNSVLRVNGEEVKLGLGEIHSIGRDKGKIQLIDIDEDRIKIDYTNIKSDGDYSDEEYLDLDRNQQKVFGDSEVRLVKINLDKQVKLDIKPVLHGPRTESDFSFKIGIEKRGIKLSDDEAREMMKNLEEQIDKWNEVNEKLGNVVKGLKGACFATSAMLTVKNFFSGMSGESMARKSVMTKNGGWNDFCEGEVENGNFSSVQSCLVEHNPDIEDDVKLYAEKIKETNKRLEKIQEEVGVKGSDVLDLQGQTNEQEVRKKFKNEFEGEFCEKSGTIKLPGDKGEVSINEICKWSEAGTLTHSQRKDIWTLYETRQAGGSSVLQDSLSNELGMTSLNAKDYYVENEARKKAEEEADKLGMRVTNLPGDRVVLGHISHAEEGDSFVEKDVKKGGHLIAIPIPESLPPEALGENVKYNPNGLNTALVELKRQENGEYRRVSGSKIYDSQGNELGPGSKEYKAVKEYLGYKRATRFREASDKAYQNQMNTEGVKIKYFEREPYKGLPAQVPFDVQNGWYVNLDYVLSGFGKPYDESGRAVNYYICNVGANGEIEYKKANGDDICRYYNGNTADLNFPGMDAAESRRLVSRAQQALSEASRQYGQERATVNGHPFDTGISFEGGNGRCTDFMSPQDCKIMFNVCDPVICPASRCDLGGTYRVDNVIQTGIIGSLTLCLPNIKEGIAVPICLTGVHAGIEGYISILNSTKQCLNESIETGRNIGICDEIKSIYMCDFFWDQVQPFMEVLIPRLLESFMGQGVRGGGEYLTVNRAWQNTQDSIDYFKNEYAVNSMEAFNKRSVAEIGSDFCKSHVSAVYPTGDMFDELIEPDSPVQYHAWFSEDELTSATVPATSHYKVYYHIYAGKDSGTYYRVYLKDLPESNYIHSRGIYNVDTDYIPRGGQVDRAEDFSAVAGYKQLCININGKEECGFGKVSTSYAVNRLSDEYAKEQASQTDINSEEECVAGTPSLYSMAQPNLQEGMSDTVSPGLYNSGITRVCSTYNPGKQVTSSGEYDTTNSTYDEWKQVGWCDKEANIACWLDTNTVKDVIRDKNLTQQAIEEVDLNMLGAEGYLTVDESKGVASEAENFTSGLKKGKLGSVSTWKNKLNKLINLGANNVLRARGLYLLGKLYAKAVDLSYEYPEPEAVGDSEGDNNGEDNGEKGSEDENDGNEDSEEGNDVGTKKQGFYLNDKNIYYSENNTEFDINEKENGYQIIYDDKIAGFITNENINFKKDFKKTLEGDVLDYANELGKYSFDGKDFTRSN